MDNNYGKIGLFAGFVSFILLVVGVRNVLGHDIEIMNFFAFAVFSLIIGISCTMLIFYKLRIAFTIFIIGLILAFFEMFRSYIMNINGVGDSIGILSLFMISSFGLGISLIVQFIVILVRKK